MIFCDCLPILLARFSLFPLYGGVSRKSEKQVKDVTKNGKDLKSLRGDNTGPFEGSGG